METLTGRQKLILALVVREYIKSAKAVGSKLLVENYSLDVSSATVRNEMLALSEQDLLSQPHPSAGRVPTEKGYRYFVRQLMGQTDLPNNVKRTIAHQFYQAGNDIERWMRLAASILAHQSQAAALVTTPYIEKPKFKHLELISTRGQQVLMVLVFMGGEVRQHMLALAEPVLQEHLSATADKINAICQGLDAEKISSAAEKLDDLGKDILKIVVEEIQREGSGLGQELYRDGLDHVLAEPEFAEIDIARKALRVLEERSLLEDMLVQSTGTIEIGGVQVMIGGEDTWEELSECSMILARYGAPELATGTLGVLGPIRMTYGHTISTVRFVAHLLSDLIIELHSE